MNYHDALVAAGAVIECSKSFGSYQGDAWFLATLPDGRRGWLCISYGSCSGCDSLEAEMRGSSHEHEDGCYWFAGDEPLAGCALCDKFKLDIASFGAGYFDELMTQAEAEKKAAENIEWDEEAKDVVAYVHSNALKDAPVKEKKR